MGDIQDGLVVEFSRKRRRKTNEQQRPGVRQAPTNLVMTPTQKKKEAGGKKPGDPFKTFTQKQVVLAAFNGTFPNYVPHRRIEIQLRKNGCKGISTRLLHQIIGNLVDEGLVETLGEDTTPFPRFKITNELHRYLSQILALISSLSVGNHYDP